MAVWVGGVHVNGLVHQESDDNEMNPSLSACSPFFKKLLKVNPHPSPLIYLKGVSYESLQLVLRFMYLGETVSY